MWRKIERYKSKNDAFLTLYYPLRQTKELIFALFSLVSAWDDLVTVKYSFSVPEMNANKQRLFLVHPVQMSNGKQLFAILSRSSPTRSPPITRRLKFVPIKRVRTWRSKSTLAIEGNISPIADFIIATRRTLERDESIFWTLELATQGHACRDLPLLTT